MEDFEPDQLKQALRENMRKRHKEALGAREAKQLPRKRQLKRQRWEIAAGFLLGLGLSLWFFLPRGEADSQDLFASNFEPLANTIAPSVRGEEDRDHLGQAMQAYDAGQFEKALVSFAKVEESEHSNGFYLYQAIALLATGNGDEATEQLEKIEPGSNYQNDKDWYLALSYLQTSRKADSKALLEVIKDDKSHVYQTKASELLKALD